MDLFTFLSSLVKSLAWPVAVIVAVIVFRKAIVDRIGSIRKISHKGTAVEFDHAAREVKAAIAAERLPSPPAALLGQSAQQTHHVGRIVQTWVELEDILRERLMKAGLETGNASGARLVRLTYENGLITDEQQKSLLGLSTMRNLAVHGHADQIGEARTGEFIALADAIKTVLEMTKLRT